MIFYDLLMHFSDFVDFIFNRTIFSFLLSFGHRLMAINVDCNFFFYEINFPNKVKLFHIIMLISLVIFIKRFRTRFRFFFLNFVILLKKFFFFLSKPLNHLSMCHVSLVILRDVIILSCQSWRRFITLFQFSLLN